MEYVNRIMVGIAVKVEPWVLHFCPWFECYSLYFRQNTCAV